MFYGHPALLLCCVGSLVSAQTVTNMLPDAVSRGHNPQSSSSSSYTIDVFGGLYEVADGSYWDQRRHTLYFVDIPASTVYRYDACTGVIRSVKVDYSLTTSIVIPVRGQPNKFIVTVGTNVTIMTWNGESRSAEIDTIFSVDQEPRKENNRFNDGKVDPTGRLWIGSAGWFREDGSFEFGRGSLFTFENYRGVTPRLGGVDLSNGMAWDSNLKCMYFVDSLKYKVFVFEYDAKSGEIAYKRVLFDVRKNIRPKTDGLFFPDGLTIDTKGNIWVSIFGAALVINIDTKTGAVIRGLELPALQPTSLSFGGKCLDELYITTAMINLTPEEMKQYPASGRILKVKGLGVKGYPGMPAELGYDIDGYR